MRLRKVEYAADLIHSFPDYVIQKPEDHIGNWNKLFGNDNPIELEIGCGKGKFIFEKAMNNPNINYIGVEKFDSVIVRALEKIIETHLPNLKFIRFDAEHMMEVFAKGEISKIYLNFSDPWPKKRHAKNIVIKNFISFFVLILFAK